MSLINWSECKKEGSISAGRPFISFQSGEKYRFYLQHKSKYKVEEWIEFISTKLKYPIESLGVNQKLNIPIDIVHGNIDELVEIIRRLV